MKMIKGLKKVIFILVALVAFVSVTGNAQFVNAEDINVAQVGEEQYLTLADAIKDAQDGSTVTLLSNVELNAEIEVKTAITIDLNNHTITSTAKDVFKLYKDMIIKNGTIINNSTITSARCINVRDKVNLTIEGVDLETPKSANAQPLTIGGSTNGSVISIEHSILNAGKSGYAIIAFTQSELTVEDSTVTGYAALYFKADGTNATSAGSTVSIVDSNLKGYAHKGESFGAIVFEVTNVAVNMEGGSLTIERAQDGDYDVAAYPVFKKAFGETESSVKFDKTNVVSLNGLEVAERVAYVAINGTAINITSLEHLIEVLDSLKESDELRLVLYKDVDLHEIVELRVARALAIHELAEYASSLGVTVAEISNYDVLVSAINEASKEDIAAKLEEAKAVVNTIAHGKDVPTEDTLSTTNSNNGLIVALVIVSILALLGIGTSVYLFVTNKTVDTQEEKVVQDELPAEVNENNVFAKLNKKPVIPFAMRLEYSTVQNKEFYKALKAKLCENSKVKSRLSNRCESFRIGRKLIAKITMSGNTLKLYLALNPNDFPVNT